LTAERQLDDFRVLMELAEAEPEAEQARHEEEMGRELAVYAAGLDRLELEVFLNGPHDRNACVLSVNAGAGGTESCDWANMLLRMYQRWAERRGWKIEVTDALAGDVAGIKSATLLIEGENAYGFCKAERGVHRLVRISPFDSNKRRHTSFASVDVVAEVDEVEQAAVPAFDLEVDTYRSGGEGGPEREQGGDGNPDQACADGDCGGVPESAVAASEPGDGDEDSVGEDLCVAPGRTTAGNGEVLWG
jgi:peptide chain release factor 2